MGALIALIRRSVAQLNDNANFVDTLHKEREGESERESARKKPNCSMELLKVNFKQSNIKVSSSIA